MKDDILSIISQYSGELPSWFSTYFWNLFAILLLLKLLFRIKEVTQRIICLELSIKAVQVAKCLIKKLLFSIFSQLESPIERPRSKLLFKAIILFHSYSMAVIFLLLFISVSIGVIVDGLPNTIQGQLAAIGLLCFFLYLAIFFRSESDREYLALKKYWAEKVKK